MNTEPQKLVYSVQEAAAQLGVGRTTVFELIRTRQLASIKIGQRRLVTRADVESFVEQLRTGVTVP